MRKFIIIIIVLIGCIKMHGQSIIVFNENNDKFPAIKASFYAKDKQNKLLGNLNPSNLRVVENGIPRKVVSVTCPTDVTPSKISSVLVMDVTASMSNGSIYTNMDIAKSAAKRWIASLPINDSECAITSFDNDSYLNQDFTSHKQRLTDAVNALQPGGGTNYDAGFIKGVGAALSIVKRAKHKRIIVFLTDGQGVANEQEIILQAANENTQIYCIGVNVALPAVLKNIAKKTNGEWFENISSRVKIEEVYERILQTVLLSKPCELVWETDFSCQQKRTAEIIVSSQTLQTKFEYSITDINIPKISLSSFSEQFEDISPGNTDTRDITITAKTDGVVITNIISSNAAFVVENTPGSEWRLNRGQTKTFRVRFVPLNSTLTSAEIRVEGNICDSSSLYVIGGYPNIRDPKATLRVVLPNGSERFSVGDTTSIRWTGVLPSDTVQLDYSTNNGTSWLLITKKATGLSHRWKIPPTIENSCLFRVKRYHKRYADSLLFLEGHEDTVNEACFSPDGLRAVTVSDDRKFIVWNTRTGLPVFLPVSLPDSGAGYSVDWSSDGTKIVAGHSKGAGIYDAATFDYIQSALMTPMKDPVNSCVFSKDGLYVVAVNNVGIILSEIESKQVEIFPTEHTGHINRIALGYNAAYHITVLSSADDRTAGRSEIEITSNFNSIIRSYSDLNSTDYSVAYVGCPAKPGIYCAAFRNGQLQFYPSFATLSLFGGDPINDIDWSPDGKYIAAALNSGRLAIIDVAAQKIVRRLDTVRGSALSIRWDAFNTRVVAGYTNNLALIWQIDDQVDQEDISDNTWEISAPVLTVNNFNNSIDFGQVLVNYSKDSIIQSILCVNQNPLSSSRIDSAVILNDINGSFRIVSGVPADFSRILPSCLPMELSFHPKAIGLETATFRLFSNGQIFDISLVGNGFTLGITYPDYSIDLGKVPIGNTVDTIFKITIGNYTGFTLNIPPMTIAGPDTKQFFITDTDTTVLLNNEELKKIHLVFTPKAIGRTSSRVRIDFKRQGAPPIPGSPIYITLVGEGICNIDSARIVNVGLGKEIPTRVGEIIKIPLVMKQQPELSLDEIVPKFFCTLSFDATMLLPLDPLPTGVIEKARRIVSFEAECLFDTDTLMLMPFLTLLGSDSIVTVHIDSLYINDGGCPITAQADSVSIMFRDLCVAGGSTRLLASSPITEIALVSNPADDYANIKITLSEDSPITIALHDALGREVIVRRKNFFSRGSHNEILDCSLISSGIYTLVLSTRSEVKFLQFAKR